MLAENFHYASQWFLEEIESKTEYLNYIVPKLEAIRESGSSVWAEMGCINRECSQPCVIMAQGDRDDLVALVFAKIEDEKIERLDLWLRISFAAPSFIWWIPVVIREPAFCVKTYLYGTEVYWRISSVNQWFVQNAAEDKMVE